MNNTTLPQLPDTYFICLRQDLVALCQKCEKRKEKSRSSPHCKALILSILDHWTYDNQQKKRSLAIHITIPQWIDLMYGMFKHNVIADSLEELCMEGWIERTPFKPINGGKEQYRYTLTSARVVRAMATLKFQGCQKEEPGKITVDTGIFNDQPGKITDATLKNQPSTLKFQALIEDIDTQIETKQDEREESDTLTSSQHEVFSLTLSSDISNSSQQTEESPTESPIVPTSEPPDSDAHAEQMQQSPIVIPSGTTILEGQNDSPDVQGYMNSPGSEEVLKEVPQTVMSTETPPESRATPMEEVSEITQEIVPKERPRKEPPKNLLAKASPEAQAIVQEWVSIFKKPVAINKTLIGNAEDLADSHPEPGEIKGCYTWLWKTDRDWYAKHGGVHLGTIASKFAGFRSLGDIPDDKSRKRSIDRSDFSQQTLDQEFYPTKAPQNVQKEKQYAF